MIELDDLYFKWLMEKLDEPSPAVVRLCAMLWENVFQRRVGNDVNRAIDGANLRLMFLDDYAELDVHPVVVNDFVSLECTWLEMLIALANHLDYLYDGGIQNRFLELVTNLGLDRVIFTPRDPRKLALHDELDQELVDIATTRVDNNEFDRLGRDGLFPLTQDRHPDQREVEIWDQHSAYFLEKLGWRE